MVMRFLPGADDRAIVTWARISTFRQVISGLVVEVGFMAGMMKSSQQYRLRSPVRAFHLAAVLPARSYWLRRLVYFTEAMLKRHGMGFEGDARFRSWPGNVAQYAIEKRWNLRSCDHCVRLQWHCS